MSRVSVPLAQAYRLTNHGPTILVSAAHGNQRNLMAAAWNMPLDFDPPKIAVVIDKRTYTRELIEAAGSFAINVPCRAQAEMVKATRNAMIQGFGKMSDEQRIRLADSMRKQADRRLKGPGRMDGQALPPPPDGPGGMEFDAPVPPPDGPPPQ